jgi:predicted AAA+ superfamily ATPase
VDLLFNEIPSQSGRKFIFSHLSGENRARDLHPALDLLVKADMVHKIYHTAGNGIPLGAEINFKRYKLLFLDIALHQYLLGLHPGESIIHPLDYMINNGALAEVLGGQELAGYSSPLKKSPLYYWHREAKSSNAEVDYLIVHSGNIIPLEIKAGKAGRLKSLQQFLSVHPSTPYGMVFNDNYPAQFEDIKSLPLYAFCRIAEDIHFEL